MNRLQLIRDVFFIFLLFDSIILSGQTSTKLTEDAKISIITFGPYQEELWSAFGHSGIRVYDPNLNINWMYDWGRFDFNQTNFYWNFAKGQMLYSIGRTKDFNRYKNYYISQDRYIYEQVLNITPEETQKFFDYLEENNRPENKQYYYNYVYDNCATKIREVTEAVIPGISFDYSYKKEGKSVRDLMDDYLGFQPWGDFIIDVALASPIDKEAEASVYMFLPDYVFFGFEKATINRDSISIPLLSNTNYIYKVKKEPTPVGSFTPLNTFVILFFVVGFITNKNYRTLKRSHWLDVILFSIVGFFGWWFTFLWFATDHLSANNWNLLWALPFHLPFIFFLTNKKWQHILSRVYRFTAVLYCLILIFWAIIPQPLHHALIPLLLMMILRAFYISYDLGRIKIGKN